MQRKESKVYKQINASWCHILTGCFNHVSQNILSLSIALELSLEQMIKPLLSSRSVISLFPHALSMIIGQSNSAKTMTVRYNHCCVACNQLQRAQSLLEIQDGKFQLSFHLIRDWMSLLHLRTLYTRDQKATSICCLYCLYNMGELIQPGTVIITKFIPQIVCFQAMNRSSYLSKALNLFIKSINPFRSECSYVLHSSIFFYVYIMISEI